MAMLWSSVQLMASAMASTPRQLAAVSCFSGSRRRAQTERQMWTEGERAEKKRKNVRLIEADGGKKTCRRAEASGNLVKQGVKKWKEEMAGIKRRIRRKKRRKRERKTTEK